MASSAWQTGENSWKGMGDGITNYNWDIFDLTGQKAAQTAFQNQQALDYIAWQRSELSAQNQRAWEEKMSSTAIQRQVADAQAAGINPAALFGNGASGAGAETPSGSSASSSGGSSHIANNKLAAAAGVLALFLKLVIGKK